jgi:hypothetical protein
MSDYSFCIFVISALGAAGALSLLGMYALAPHFSAPFLTIFLGFFY